MARFYEATADLASAIVMTALCFWSIKKGVKTFAGRGMLCFLLTILTATAQVAVTNAAPVTTGYRAVLVP